jgi:cell pole-organizing protein PopZ
MEEILASIRRIIADDDASKTAKAPEPPPPAPKPVPPVAAVPRPVPAPPPPPPAPPRAAPPPPPPPPPRPVPVENNQDDIDAMLADLDAPPKVEPKLEPKPAPPPPKPVAPPPPPPPDVLDLTEAMAAPPPPPPPAPSFRTIDGANDVVFSDRAAEPAMRTPEEPRPRFAADSALISNATMAAVDGAFNSLAQTVLGNNARTLEDLVKEMLRPMLKSWLDDNLPGMVERIVRAEIERVSRGR